MIKKSWTPDNCPLQVGSVLHNVNTNDAYAIIQENAEAILRGLKECVEEKDEQQ